MALAAILWVPTGRGVLLEFAAALYVDIKEDPADVIMTYTQSALDHITIDGQSEIELDTGLLDEASPPYHTVDNDPNYNILDSTNGSMALGGNGTTNGTEDIYHFYQVRIGFLTHAWSNVEGKEQDHSALAVEILQSCTKPSIL